MAEGCRIITLNLLGPQIIEALDKCELGPPEANTTSSAEPNLNAEFPSNPLVRKQCCKAITWSLIDTRSCQAMCLGFNNVESESIPVFTQC